MPNPVRNIFKDMRDRRMLPLVALLILAIVAVPLLLKTDSEPATPASAVTSDPTAGIEGAEIADPVVLTEVPGIRNYHERLASLQERNPFKQQFTSVPKAAGTGSGDGATDEAASGTGTSTSTGTSDSTTTPDTTTPETSTPDGKRRTYLYYWEIDAKAGAVGEGEKMSGIRALDYVPGKSHPILQFIRGVGEQAAIFVVSRSVGDTHGDGNCQPRPEDCQFLKLELGESTTFNYEPNGLDYRIKLTGVHLLRKRIHPGDPSSTSATDDFAQLSADG
jgi:hypothetical protein